MLIAHSAKIRGEVIAIGCFVGCVVRIKFSLRKLNAKDINLNLEKKQFKILIKILFLKLDNLLIISTLI